MIVLSSICKRVKETEMGKIKKAIEEFLAGKYEGDETIDYIAAIGAGE